MSEDEESIEDLLDSAIEDVAEQSDLDPNVYYWDLETAIEEMDGLHQVVFLSEEQRESRDLQPAGHSMEDLQEMPDYVTMEALVEAEYGEVLDRRWIDGLEMDIDTDFGIYFHGGAYLIEDDGLQEYVVTGSKKKSDGTPFGDELSFYPAESYDSLDEVLEDKFVV